MIRQQAGTALFVGDCSLDTTVIVERLPEPDEKVHVQSIVEAPGGVVANAAAACAKAGADCRLAIVTGDDLAAGMVCAGLSALGVGVEDTAIGGRTCRVVILVEPHGEKRLLLDPGVSMYPSPEQIGDLALDGVGWVHTAAYGEAAARLAQRCLAVGIRWSLDLEPATFPNGIGRLAPVIAGAQTVFCNQRAGARIGDEPAQALLAMGARAVVLTLGAQGARLIRADSSELWLRSPVSPKVKDTTGAGDCLAGWFVAGRLAGLSDRDCLAQAVAAAALSCEGLGAQPSFPDRRSLEEFLARNGQRPPVEMES